MNKLKDKVAVITGGTSGMALATAKLFVEEGAYVFITGRGKEQLEKAKKEIGKNVTAIQADSSNLDEIDKIYDIVKKEKGKIDVLFASAGRGDFKVLGEITEQHYNEIFDLNVKGTIFTVQKALPLFNKGGSIIINGSIASIKGNKGFSVYSASKAALRCLVRSWILELVDRGLRVNVLSPGTIDTPILGPIDQKQKDEFVSRIPRGTMGRPEEIATVALFLASNDSSFVNGVELFVDGGTAQI